MSKDGTLKGILGQELLDEIQDTYLRYLESSAAIYEGDGEYASSFFSSKYCDFLNQASKKLSKGSGKKWLCHEDCWAVSKKAMDQKKPCEIECTGGIKIYAAPIIVDGGPIGVNNAGVSNPPTDEKRIDEIAKIFEVDPKKLMSLSKQYTPRPDYLFDAARNQITVMSKVIAELFLWKSSEMKLNAANQQLKATEQQLKATNQQLKASEEELQRREQYLKVIFDSVHFGMILVDAETHIIVDVNTEVVRLFGAPREMIVGKICHDYICPAEKGKCPISDLGQSVDNSERSLVKADGTKLAILKTVTPILLNKRKLFLESFIDISERKKIEDVIKCAAEEWQSTFDSISDIVFILDRDNTIRRVNKVFLDAFKLKAEDVIGKKCYQIVHKAHEPWKTCPHVKTVEDGKPHTEEVDDPVLGIPLMVSTSPIFNKDGKCVGSVHIAKEITELKRIRKELEEKVNSLERFQAVTIGREKRVIELKNEIKALKEEIAKRSASIAQSV